MAADAAAHAAREHPDLVRGVLTLEAPRVGAVFAPLADCPHIVARLETAGIEVLGVGRAPNAHGGYTFAAVVRSVDVSGLSALVAEPGA